MGADQQFCLRWNNFHTNITSAFESLRDDEDFVDITLACEGRQVKAHKMVLSACSPYFRSLLKGNPCQHPIVFLKDVTFANLASILDFMYHGEVNVSHNELATFLKTAEALKVRGLAEDDKKKDSDGYIEGSSPGPPRDPPDPGASPRPDDSNATDTRLSDSPPPHKKQRRRSGASVQSAEDTNETVNSDMRETSVKNEPQEFIDDDDMLGHSAADSTAADIKADNSVNDEGDDRNNFGLSDSVSISRSQAAMQQLQESFGSFLPAMSQSSGFLPHGATEMPRPPFPLEGVQGLPPGISTLPGPSMSQAGASQDTSQGEGDKEQLDCTFCGKNCSSRYNLKKHVRDLHLNKGTKFTCLQCHRNYSSLNSLQVHRSVTHPTGNKRKHSQSAGRRRPSNAKLPHEEIVLDDDSQEHSIGPDPGKKKPRRNSLSAQPSLLSEQHHHHRPVELLQPHQQGLSQQHQQQTHPTLQTPTHEGSLHGQTSNKLDNAKVKRENSEHLGITDHGTETSLPPQAHSNHSSPPLRDPHPPPRQAHSHDPPTSSHTHSSLSPQLHNPISPQVHTAMSPQHPQQSHTPGTTTHPVHSPYLQSPSQSGHSSLAAQLHMPLASLPPKSPSTKGFDMSSHVMSSHTFHHSLANPPHAHHLHHPSSAHHLTSPYGMQHHAASFASSAAALSSSPFHPMDSSRLVTASSSAVSTAPHQRLLASLQSEEPNPLSLVECLHRESF